MQSKILDQTENKALVKGLENFGLSEKEAAVYLALLPRRDIGSSKLVLATGLHKQFVYNALARLEELGLAKHVIQNGRKKFSANTPMRIVSLLEEKKLSAQSIAKQLLDRYSGSHEQDFEVFQGDEAFMAHQIDLLERSPEESEISVIACETERYMATAEKLGLAEEYERIRRGKRISIRYIGSEVQRPRLEHRERTEQPWTFRILPGHRTGVMNTDVWHDNVTFNIFGETILSITITGKDLSEGYKTFFETLWNLSSK